MAADSNQHSLGFMIFVSLYLLVSVIFPSASTQAQNNHGSLCTDGTYEHEGRECCLCGAGLHLVEHCSTSQTYGKCEPCGSGKYSSHPNYQLSCEPCTSCSHPNGNLEVDEPCTPAVDTKCRCKKDHYCNSGTETCKLCHPCKECGDEGIKVACTSNNNTVCNEIKEVSHVGGIIAGILVAVVIIAAAVAGVLWKRRKWQRTQSPKTNGNEADLEMQGLRVFSDVDLKPHLLDIADVIGWKDLRGVAMRSGIPESIIESCQLNNPRDCQEQTFQLLNIYVERQGREASSSLIQKLLTDGKKAKAQKVKDILSKAARSNISD